MKIADLNLHYSKGKPPKNLVGPALHPYLTPDYLRGKAKPELVPKQPGSVNTTKNDVVLLWDGSNAGEFFQAKEGILSSTMVKFDKNKKIDSEYLFYALKNLEYELKSKTAGSGIPHVDKDVLLSLDIEVPTPKEQQKIAQILTKADEAILHTERLIAKYQAIRTGLMQDLLTRGIDEAGNVRSEETHAFKDSELGRIPVEWEVKRLEDMANVIDPQPDHRTPQEDKDGILYVGISDVDSSGFYVRTSRRIVKEAYLQQKKRFTPKVGDIIFGKRGTIGKTQIIKENYPAALSSNLILFQPYKASSLLYHITKASYFERQVVDLTLSTTQPAFNMGDARDLLLALPKSDVEANRIGWQLDKVEQEITDLRLTSLKQANLKTALMQELLTGKKRVDDLLK